LFGIGELTFQLPRERKKITMNNPIGHLNKIFDSRIRLGVMSMLLVNNDINFNDLKQLLELTDGNLASHLSNLEENGYIKVHKGFIGRKTNTTYSITKAGEKAFKEHLTALEHMIKGIK
jgi:DNA-binding MarR family transcriptional regulator